MWIYTIWESQKVLLCAPLSLTKIKSVEACEQFCSILKCWFTVLSDDKRQTYETRILTQ